jgi:hypothetical protein
MLAWKSLSLCCLFAQMLPFPHRRNRSVGVGFRGDLPRIAVLQRVTGCGRARLIIAG